MNILYLLARVVNDPDYRYATDGSQLVRFRVAVGRKFKKAGETDTDFFNVTAFGKTAERMERCFIGKGTKMLLTCELLNNNYVDKEGKKHYEDQIVVREFEFVEKRQDKPSDPANDDFVKIQDESELPFR